jgi:hypothetical protein
MTAKKSKKTKSKGKDKGKKAAEEKPLLNMRFVGFLILASLASAVITFYYNRPPAKVDPHKKNPNIVKLRPIPKKNFTPYEMSKEQTYMEKVVFKYIRKNQTPVKNCYFGYKGKFRVNPKGYKVVLQFSIPNDGKIKNVRFWEKRTELKVKPIRQCILKEAGKWQFRPHKMAKPLTMSFPLFFR